MRGEKKMTVAMKKGAKLGGGCSLEETIVTSLLRGVAACMRGASPPRLSCSEEEPSPGSQQPASSPFPPANRHARLSLRALLSDSAARAERRGTATAAPSIFPGMRRSRVNALFPPRLPPPPLPRQLHRLGCCDIFAAGCMLFQALL